jgi:hypothetical protein
MECSAARREDVEARRAVVGQHVSTVTNDSFVRRRFRLPPPRLGQARGRLDLVMRATENRRLAFGRLDDQPVTATGTQVHFGLGARERRGTPPVAQLPRIGPGPQYPDRAAPR